MESLGTLVKLGPMVIVATMEHLVHKEDQVTRDQEDHQAHLELLELLGPQDHRGRMALQDHKANEERGANVEM